VRAKVHSPDEIVSVSLITGPVERPALLLFTGFFSGRLGNGSTRMTWDHENPGSNPGRPTSVS